MSRGYDRPRDSAVHGSLFECLCEVSSGGSLFLWVDEVEERLSDEEVSLVFEMVGEDGVEVDEV